MIGGVNDLPTRCIGFADFCFIKGTLADCLSASKAREVERQIFGYLSSRLYSDSPYLASLAGVGALLHEDVLRSSESPIAKAAALLIGVHDVWETQRGRFCTDCVASGPLVGAPIIRSWAWARLTSRERLEAVGSLNELLAEAPLRDLPSE